MVDEMMKQQRVEGPRWATLGWGVENRKAVHIVRVDFGSPKAQLTSISSSGLVVCVDGPVDSGPIPFSPTI